MRELEACAKRGIALADAAVLDAHLLPEPVTDEMQGYGRVSSSSAEPAAAPIHARTGTPTEAELRTLLSEHGGNVAAVGRVLGKARMQIHRWVERYNIQLDDYRTPET